MNVIQNYLLELDEISTLMDSLHKKDQNVLLTGATPSFYGPLLHLIYKKQRRPIVVMTQNLYHAQRLYDQMTNMMDECDVLLFPMDEFITAEMLASSSELRIERMNTLSSILEDECKIVITHVAGATRYLTPKSIFSDSKIELKSGEIYDLHILKTKLVELGYTSVRTVERMGEFSSRGGIIDIFPMTEEDPIRVEFFDDEVDTIRYFSTETQRSIKNVNQIIIPPTFELVYSDTQIENFEKQIKALMSKTLPLLEGEARENLTNKVFADIENIKNHHQLDLLHKYTALLYEQ
ncbi:MAG: transcription-repair coupling factor, partial [Turicibacter sp.]